MDIKYHCCWSSETLKMALQKQLIESLHVSLVEAQFLLNKNARSKRLICQPCHSPLWLSAPEFRTFLPLIYWNRETSYALLYFLQRQNATIWYWKWFELWEIQTLSWRVLGKGFFKVGTSPIIKMLVSDGLCPSFSHPLVSVFFRDPSDA